MIRVLAVVRRFGLLVVGLIGIAVGNELLLFQSQPPLDRRFSAYAPLSNSYFVPSFVTPVFLLGLALLVVGIALVAGWVGFALGRGTMRAQHP